MNMNTEDFCRELIERSEKVESQIRAIKKTLQYIVENGMPDNKTFEELLDDNLFKEDHTDRSEDCLTEVGIIIEHLLKLKYCTNDRNHKVWTNSVETHRGTLYGYTKWLVKHPIVKLVNYIEENLDDCYDFGVSLYTKAARKYPDLREGLELIPEECPWTLEELMDMDIDELLKKMDIKEEEIDNE